MRVKKKTFPMWLADIEISVADIPFILQGIKVISRNGSLSCDSPKFRDENGQEQHIFIASKDICDLIADVVIDAVIADAESDETRH